MVSLVITSKCLNLGKNQINGVVRPKMSQGWQGVLNITAFILARLTDI